MKPEEIQKGKTYRGTAGPDRTARFFFPYQGKTIVEYMPHTITGALYKECTLTAFAKWAVEEVKEEK